METAYSEGCSNSYLPHCLTFYGLGSPSGPNLYHFPGFGDIVNGVSRQNPPGTKNRHVFVAVFFRFFLLQNWAFFKIFTLFRPPIEVTAIYIYTHTPIRARASARIRTHVAPTLQRPTLEKRPIRVWLGVQVLFCQRHRNDDKNKFWEVESKGGSAGGSKEGQQGTHLEILLSA